MKSTIIILTTLLIYMNLSAQTNNINIIPKPQEIKILDGKFTLTSSTKILYDEQTHKIAEYFADEIDALYGLKIIVEKSPGESGDNVIESPTY
jgi:hypothetical protein